MKYSLKKSCAECPYLPKMPGWIGSHESGKEFHEIARADMEFSCHMNPEFSCAGNAMYMNAMCKLSKNKQKSDWQKQLRDNCHEQKDVLFSFDGSKINDYHNFRKWTVDE